MALFPLLYAAGVVHAHLESKLDAVDLSQRPRQARLLPQERRL
jgi:hypothetical protein